MGGPWNEVEIGTVAVGSVPSPAGESTLCAASNFASTEVASSIVTAHSPTPEQPPPDQPAKVEPGSGVAVRATGAPERISAEQVLAQSIPPRLEVTTPPHSRRR